MRRHSSITYAWIMDGSGSYKPAVGIRNLVCVQLHVVQCLDVVAASGTQKPSPEGAQMIPSRAQVLVVVIRNEPQVTQAERCNDTGDRIGHREQGGGKPGILPGGEPGDDERISHQLNRPLAW